MTTNHDLLLERNVPQFWELYSDGFRARDHGGPALWAEAFDDPELVPFIKLHGSVDWRRVYQDRGGGEQLATVATSRGMRWDASRVARESGLTVNHSAILVGTFNKGLDYHAGVFGDLYWWFESLLRGSHRLLVLGYGFSDKALNSSIIRWMLRGEGRQLLIGDIAPAAMLGRARPAVQREVPRWRAAGRASLYEGCVSQLADSDVLAGFLG